LTAKVISATHLLHSLKICHKGPYAWGGMPPFWEVKRFSLFGWAWAHYCLYFYKFWTLFP